MVREINKKKSGLRIIGKIIKDYTLSSFVDFSTYILLITNLFIIYEFFINISSPEIVFFLYLSQSIIMFFFFGLLILSLRKFIAKGKVYSEKIKTGLIIFVAFFWIFYGIAHYILLQPLISIKFDYNILISIGLFFLTYILSSFIKFRRERERLEKIELVKTFFEPAIILLPIYLGIVFGVIIGGIGALFLLFIFKIWADLISNSPLNAEEPFVYKILKDLKENREV